MTNIQDISSSEINKARLNVSKSQVFASGVVKSVSQPSWRQIPLAFLGAFAAISSLALVAGTTHYPLILGSFGASCCILFGFPETPFARPRNVIGGHFIASLTGLVFLFLFGVCWWSLGLALATSIALMLATGTTHPPAASNPVIVMLSSPAWSFLIAPTLIGAFILVFVAAFYNEVTKKVSQRN